jgi:hypothetical protein
MAMAGWRLQPLGTAAGCSSGLVRVAAELTCSGGWRLVVLRVGVTCRSVLAEGGRGVVA